MDLKPFDTSMIRGGVTKFDAKIALFIGKHAVGKTTSIKSLLRMSMNPNISDITVITPVERNSRYAPVLLECMRLEPPCSVVSLFESMEDQVLRGVVQRTKAEDFKHAFLVLDDCMYASPNPWKSCKTLSVLLLSPKSLGVTTLMTMQYPQPIPPAFRCNMSYVFLFRENNINNLKRLYDFYGCIVFKTFESFCETMNRYVQKQGEALVLNLKVNSRGCSDEPAFWYKGAVDSSYEQCERSVKYAYNGDQQVGNKRFRME